MMAQQLHVEVISNNIANMTTTGYKRRRPEFQDLLYQSQRRIGATSSAEGTVVPAGVQLGLGVKTAAVYRIHEQGELVNTENSFDLAIQGSGYFVVELPSGELAYTRSGNFQLSPDGQLVTPDGYTVSPGITVPQDAVEVSINQEGHGLGQDRGPGRASRSWASCSSRPSSTRPGSRPSGSNLLQETAASGPALAGPPGTEGLGTVLQGFLESSNVNPVQEITALIAAQRAYDMNSKVITASDEMMATVTQLR